MAVKLSDGVYWVGVVDWNVRDFHGYTTHRGTTYNAYLVLGEKKALIDTVKKPFFGEMLARIKEVIDPAELDYIILNHMEMDHSTSFPDIKALAPKAEVIVSKKFGEDNFRKIFHGDWDLTPVTEGDKVDLGGLTLTFVPIPMLHWPDSMVTYLIEKGILFSSDAFGQHLASAGRFDDEVDNCALWEEVTKYYANILMPFGNLIPPAVEKLGKLELNMLATAHGIIWRKDIAGIVQSYLRWARGETNGKALVIYDTMWGDTERMAQKVLQGLQEGGVEASLCSLSSSDRSDIIAEVLDAKALVVGSPTLNNGLFPSIGAFLVYLKGLRPRNKIGFAIGSYGWGGGAVKKAEDELKEAGVELVEEGIGVKFNPLPDELEKCRLAGKSLAEKIKGG
ncbi:FprA family A-type flavoprotein [Bacteroidota bacterium]